MSRYTAQTIENNLLQIKDNISNKIIYEQSNKLSAKDEQRELQKLCDLLNTEAARANKAERIICEQKELLVMSEFLASFAAHLAEKLDSKYFDLVKLKEFPDKLRPSRRYDDLGD